MPDAEDWRPTFWVFGSLAIAFALTALVSITANSDVMLRNRGVQVRSASIVALLFLVVGVGTIRCTRWGSALFALSLIAAFCWWFIGALSQQAFLSAFMAIVISPLFFAPAVVTTRRWCTLSNW